MDMDGVLWRGGSVIEGAADWLNFLRKRQIPFVLATNNSSLAPSDYTEKLAALGLGEIPLEHIITSGIVAAAYLREHYPAGAPIHVLGGDGLRAVVRDVGYVLADESPLAVVVGIDFHVTYEKLKRAARFIRDGAEFIGTNADPSIPLADGLAPGAGSLLALLETATERSPKVMGKPKPPMFLAALQALATPAAQTLMIGDRLDTDIFGAQDAGLVGALVLTGVSTREDALNGPQQPHLIISDLAELMALWG
jgi:4-nitrophenyl phosphatase